MPTEKIEFVELEKEISKTGKSTIDCLAPKIGKVYIISITRDGCPACKKQKPKMSKLTKTILAKHGDKAVFTQVHIKYPRGENAESLRSKDVLRHYFYPTNIILLRTKDKGAFEYYRSVSSRMAELERNVKTAVEIATMMQKEA